MVGGGKHKGLMVWLVVLFLFRFAVLIAPLKFVGFVGGFRWGGGGALVAWGGWVSHGLWGGKGTARGWARDLNI